MSAIHWNATNRCLQLAFLILGSSVTLGRAQQLATYDHLATNQELAQASCLPFPLVTSTDQLVNPGAPCGWTWWFGAVAADNLNARLFYANGHPCDGIQRVDFSDIGSGLPAFNFATPPGFNQVSGMVVDPRYPAGDVLWVTSGYEIAQYQVPASTGSSGLILAGPYTVPLLGSAPHTGLAWNLTTGNIHAVDENSIIWRFNPVTFSWLTGPIFPAVPVPGRATGIEFCLGTGGSAWVSYFNSTVMQPATGAVRLFPPSPTGIRRHHGLAFMGTPYSLGGGSPGGPTLTARGLPGNTVSSLVLEFGGHDVGPFAFYLAIDPTNPASAPAAAPNTLMINPATSLILGPIPSGSCGVIGMPGCALLPIPTAGLPAGLAVQVQAVALGASGARLTNAMQIMVFPQ